VAWSFIATDGRPGGLLISAEAPYTDAKFTDGLDLGNLTCTLNLKDVPAEDRLEYMDPDRTVIWPCWNGNPVGAWIVTGRPSRTLGQDQVSIVAQPALWRILDGRTVRSTLVFQQVDQLDIARDLIRYATNQPLLFVQTQPFSKGAQYAAPWLRLDTSLSGVKRDRLDNQDGWQWWERTKLADCLESLMNLQDGFEVRTVAAIENGAPYLMVQFGYPLFAGDLLAGTIEWPSGVVTAGTHGVDGTDRASLIDAIGAGQDANTLIAPWTDPVQTERMPRERAFSAGDISTYRILELAAAGEGDQAGLQEGFALTVGSDELMPYSYEWGSVFRLTIEDEGFPLDAQGQPASFLVRVRGADFQVGAFGAGDTIQLSVQVI
jgi:hypothetical protein